MVPFSELAGILIAVLILAMGLVALAWSPWRDPWLERSAIWFGLTACLYGVRLASQSALIQAYGSESFWRYLEASITYSILLPIGLFVDALFGPGWKFVLRRIWQGAAVYAPLSIAWDVFHSRPGAALWVNRPLVLVAGGVVGIHILWHWQRENPTTAFRVAGIGGLVFLCAAAYQTMGGAYPLEPPAMLIFMVSMGYLVAHRMLEGERRLVGVSRELDLARRIQHSILPHVLPDVPGLEVAAGYFPSSEIGGDFYDFEKQGGSALGLMVADVSGHGVPAALVASMVKIAFAAEADGLSQPGQALERINRILCGKFAGAYVTACCAYLDPVSGILRYSCAGHPAPWIQREDGSLERLDACGLLLAFDRKACYETMEVNVRAGDRLLFFTDGLLEAGEMKGLCFGDSAFPSLLSEGRALPPRAFLDYTITSLKTWLAPVTHLQDDITLIVMDVRAAWSQGVQGFPR